MASQLAKNKETIRVLLEVRHFCFSFHLSSYTQKLTVLD